MTDSRIDNREAVSCLLMDSCSRWLAANGIEVRDIELGEADSLEHVFQCPLHAGEASKLAGKLRYCYARDQLGYRLIYNEETKEFNNLWDVRENG